MDLNYILSDLLGCGTFDLQLFEKCSYDYDTIMDNVLGLGEEKDYGLIVLGCIYQFQNNIQEQINVLDYDIDCSIKQLEQISDENNGHLTEAEAKELERLWKEKEELEELNPRDDIEYFINYLDTQIYISDDEIKQKYSKYLSDFIQEENEMIGFCELDLN